MKHKKLSTLRRERAFIGTCLKIILRYERNGQSIPLQRVLAEAVATAPPCYNISIGRALDVFGRDGARLEEIANARSPQDVFWKGLGFQCRLQSSGFILHVGFSCADFGAALCDGREKCGLQTGDYQSINGML